ncbi:short-chain dehydrogenase/reductase-like protein SDR [Poronia punctata]|nr:short-chain dehydrogenase/reductase-like protein SDR [Poronia punctata]
MDVPYHLPINAVWFITGCSSGIGQSLAQHIATSAPSSNNRLVATARNLSSLSSPIIPDDPSRILKLSLDVTSPSAINAALEAAVSKFGRVDVVVNNAGYGQKGDTEAADDAQSRAVMDTNFWGMVDVTKKAIGIFRDVNAQTGGQGQKGGVVVNISSIGGWAGFPGQAFYHASKFAMEGFTESVARELPDAWNIHLTNIEPGGVQTNYVNMLQSNGKRHPAYLDPTFPTNVLMSYVERDEARRLWAKPSALAAAIYYIVARGEKIPIRLPLGADAWGIISKDLDDNRKLLDELKDVSFSVGDENQLEAVGFLQ